MIEKAKITKIGIVKDGTAIGWGFDAEGKNIPGVAFRDGKPALICGYTLEELTDIANTEVTDLASEHKAERSDRKLAPKPQSKSNNKEDV